LNDLQVIVADTPAQGDSMSIGLVIPYGSAFDPAGEGGLVNLLSRLFTKATLDKSASEIQNELDYLKAEVEIRADWDGFRFLISGRNSTYERALLLLYQIVAEAQFEENDFGAVKQEILQRLQDSPDPRQRIHYQLESKLFGETTYGRPLEGTLQSLTNVTVGDVRVFYSKYFSPGEASLVIVGKLPTPQVIQKATRIWGLWVRKDKVPFTFLKPRPGGRRIFLEDDPAFPAAQFILGNLWPRRQDPVYCPAMLARRILQARLTKLLPTSLLTVGSEGRRMMGPFYIQGQAAESQAVGEIRQILGAIENMKSSLVSPEELAAAQGNWTAEFNQQLSTTVGICQVLLDAELYRLGTNYAAIFPDQIKRCDADAIRQAANDWILPGNEVILLRGPAATLKPALERLGSFEQLPR